VLSSSSSSMMILGAGDSLQQRQPEQVVRFPLRFLPMGGCWALRITLTDRQWNDFSYFGIVDTGSPFLTSPSLAMERTTVAMKFPTTLEQYGESTGGMEWRQARYASIFGVEERENIILGIASSDVIQETGGIFVGLIEQDDHRPTFLQQFGYQSFAMEFRQPGSSIVFSSGSMISENDSESFELFDLTPYGPDLCLTMEFYYSATTN
jgi:hypothetical protein